MPLGNDPQSAAMSSIVQPPGPLPPPEPPPAAFSPPNDIIDEEMADLPILVENVWSDDESEDSCTSTSSRESYDDKLKALYDDHDSGT